MAWAQTCLSLEVVDIKRQDRQAMQREREGTCKRSTVSMLCA
jgi:hypothetical protein